eukprot:GEMP01057073.1.p3 GENE.GEMP01057073.1~~GEMP01057073.1.p3  ORF type:complete len:122 (+),score=25.91 GEMP01057073.1:263-628(+)
MLRRLTPLVLLYRVARSQNCESASAKVTVTAKFWYVEDYDTRGAANVDSVVRTYVDATNEALTNSKIPITSSNGARWRNYLNGLKNSNAPSYRTRCSSILSVGDRRALWARDDFSSKVLTW